MEDRFTFEQFVNDIESNSKRIISGGFITLKNDQKIYFYISDDQEVNAKALRTSKEEYILKINVGLLNRCYEYIDCNVRSFYGLASTRNNLTEEAFLRLVAGTFSEMIFWHEYSHIARGHFEYLENICNNMEVDLKYSRNIELDADIHGASCLFARIYAIYLDNNNEYSLETLMQAYSIGIRGTFEVLYRYNEFEDVLHKESKHPHSLVRAYTAIVHGLTSPVVTNLSKDSREQFTDMALAELLAFENTNNCTSINVDMLNEYMKSEWQFWYENKEVIDKYAILDVKCVPLKTKIKDFFSRLRNQLARVCKLAS